MKKRTLGAVIHPDNQTGKDVSRTAKASAIVSTHSETRRAEMSMDAYGMVWLVVTDTVTGKRIADLTIETCIDVHSSLDIKAHQYKGGQ